MENSGSVSKLGVCKTEEFDNDMPILEEVSDEDNERMVQYHQPASIKQVKHSAKPSQTTNTKPQIIYIKSESNNLNDIRAIKIVNHGKKLEVLPLAELDNKDSTIKHKITRVLDSSMLERVDISKLRNVKGKKKYKEVSNEKRHDLIRLIEMSNITVKKAAESLNINYNSAKKITRIYHQSGVLEKQIRGGSKVRKLKESEIEILRNRMNEDCSLTLEALRKFVLEKFRKVLSLATISSYISCFRYSIKRVDVVESEGSCNEMERECYKVDYMHLVSQGRRMYFLGEACFSVAMRPYLIKSSRNGKDNKVVKSPMIKTRSVTVLATMGRQRLHCEMFRQLDCAQNLENHLTKVFLALNREADEQCLFVLEYGKFSYYEDLTGLFNKFGHQVRYLPPRSLDLNPLEDLFSRWPQLVRVQNPESEKDLFSKMESVVNLVSVNQMESYITKVDSLCLKND